MSREKSKQKLLERLARLLPEGEIALDVQTRTKYAADKWFASRVPDAVALPSCTRSVAILLKYANKHRIPVTPRGAGHGYVGGAVPARGGIVLSLERMNRIIEIDPRDFVAVVQPGVITQTLQEEVERRGLFYPPDPASRDECTIGGNISTNAGGPRCLKYGVTRDYVLGLEVVLADGTVLRLGGRTHKNKTGFDLHRLFVGAEGMLGVVTEATLKLIPLPPFRANLAAGFGSMQQAARALQAIFEAGLLPCALELADEFTLAAAYKRTKSEQLRNCRAHMITELDGQEESVRSELRTLEQVIRRFDPLFLQVGLGADECEKVWKIRREFSYALRDTGLTKLNEDIVVPRGKLEDLFAFTARLQAEYRVPIACFGHAGDGNIHTNVMVDSTDPAAVKRADIVLDKLFRQVIAWGGAITGEHGIGIAKRRWWPWATSPQVRKLHKVIKHALDPNGILNPGKFIR
ncbi:MAG: FAD-binding protein [Verrucomicrobiae bacterium]|nr:FAD-binding protein [Verrucomicrobiae bacterium]MDW7980246.1 FAD-linked oxidase C-terminal domain-containing protein [Verrucomicrobiales bacterium]